MLTSNDDLDTESNQGYHELYISDCEAEIMQSEQATSSCPVLMPHPTPVLTPINIPAEPTSPPNNMLKEAEDSYVLTEMAVLKAQVDSFDTLLPYKVKNAEQSIDNIIKEISGLRYFLGLAEKHIDELHRIVVNSAKEITELKTTVQRLSAAASPIICPSTETIPTASASCSGPISTTAASVILSEKPDLITPIATITPSTGSNKTSLASTPILSPEMIPISTIETRKALLEINKELWFLHGSLHQGLNQSTGVFEETLDEHLSTQLNSELQIMEEGQGNKILLRPTL